MNISLRKFYNANKLASSVKQNHSTDTILSWSKNKSFYWKRIKSRLGTTCFLALSFCLTWWRWETKHVFLLNIIIVYRIRYVGIETILKSPGKPWNVNRGAISELSYFMASSADQPACSSLFLIAAPESFKFSATNVCVNRRKRSEELEKKYKFAGWVIGNKKLPPFLPQTDRKDWSLQPARIGVQTNYRSG